MGLFIAFLILFISLLPLGLHYILRRFHLSTSIAEFPIHRRFIQFLLVLFLITLFMNIGGYYWRGFKTDSIIYSICSVLLLVFYIFFDSPFLKNNYFFLSLFATWNAIPSVFLVMSVIQFNDRSILLNSAEYRIEEQNRTFSFKATKYIQPRVFKKTCLFEKRLEKVILKSVEKDSLVEYKIDTKTKTITTFYKDSGKIKSEIIQF